MYDFKDKLHCNGLAVVELFEAFIFSPNLLTLSLLAFMTGSLLV
jgi:hypothetical protein